MEKYYTSDNGVLYKGDSSTVLEHLAIEEVTVDNVITSPPYNTIRPNSTDRGYDFYKDGMSNEDYIRWTLNTFDSYDKILKKNGCILYNLSYGGENTTCMSLTVAEIILKSNFTLADIIVWKKHSATPNNVSKNKLTRIVEYIYVFCRKDEFSSFETNKMVIGKRDDTNQDIYENVFNFIKAPNNDESTELNKATYSSVLINWLIDTYVKPNGIVLDNFSGTVTTLKSCIIKDRKFIGVELSEAQCAYTVKRLKKGIQKSLF